VTTERIHFRLIRFPCCNYLYCAVNPRLPTYCVECGEQIYAKIKTDPSCILVSEEKATLKYRD
jgi:hypothetical protein